MAVQDIKMLEIPWFWPDGFVPNFAAAPSQTASSQPTTAYPAPLDLDSGYHGKAIILHVPHQDAHIAPPPFPHSPEAIGLELLVGAMAFLVVMTSLRGRVLRRLRAPPAL